MDGALSRRNSIRQSGNDVVRPRTPGRLPHARRAVRKFHASFHRLARSSDGFARRHWRTGFARPGKRRLLPDRTRNADRPLQQKRDPHRRVRRTASRKRLQHPRRHRGIRAHSPAPNPHDIPRLHSRRPPARSRTGSGPHQPTLGRHHSIRRNDRRNLPQFGLHSRALRPRAPNSVRIQEGTTVAFALTVTIPFHFHLIRRIEPLPLRCQNPAPSDILFADEFRKNNPPPRTSRLSLRLNLSSGLIRTVTNHPSSFFAVESGGAIPANRRRRPQNLPP